MCVSINKTVPCFKKLSSKHKHSCVRQRENHLPSWMKTPGSREAEQGLRDVLWLYLLWGFPKVHLGCQSESWKLQVLSLLEEGQVWVRGWMSSRSMFRGSGLLWMFSCRHAKGSSSSQDQGQAKHSVGWNECFQLVEPAGHSMESRNLWGGGGGAMKISQLQRRILGTLPGHHVPQVKRG